MREDDDVFAVPRRWSAERYGERCFYFDAFVSHANNDESQELVGLLRAHGLRVWYDKHQEMGDALWSTRIVWALHRSRSLICFVGSQPLDDHEWVRAEVRASDEAAKAAAVDRVAVVRAGERARVPGWLSSFPVVLRYEPGHLTASGVKRLARDLHDRNRFAATPMSPPTRELMRRAGAVLHASAYGPLLESGSRDPGLIESIAISTAQILSIVGAASTVEQVETDALFEPAFTLAKIGSAEHSRSSEATQGRTRCELTDHVIRDLVLLTALPCWPEGASYIPYWVLRRLALLGASNAAAALGECLRWETSEEHVDLVARLLAKFPEHQQRDAAIFVLLKAPFYGESWPMQSLSEADGAIRLIQTAYRLTAATLEPPTAHEFAVRIGNAIRDRDVAGLEITLLEASGEASGVMGRRVAPAEEAESCPDTARRFSDLVSRIARGWPEDQLAYLWHLPFREVVVAPLTTYHHRYGEPSGAMGALGVFLSVLESSLQEDAEALERMPVAAQQYPMVNWARLEIGSRRATVEFLRRLPTMIDPPEDSLGKQEGLRIRARRTTGTWRPPSVTSGSVRREPHGCPSWRSPPSVNWPTATSSGRRISRRPHKRIGQVY